MAKKKEPSKVYQLKMTLEQVKPPIWRRVQVRDCTFAKLHVIIQASIGWYDSHLHTFDVDGEESWRDCPRTSDRPLLHRVGLNYAGQQPADC